MAGPADGMSWCGGEQSGAGPGVRACWRPPATEVARCCRRWRHGAPRRDGPWPRSAGPARPQQAFPGRGRHRLSAVSSSRRSRWALAPAAFVTPLLLFDMVVLALLPPGWCSEQITRQGIIGIVVIITGGILLTARFRHVPPRGWTRGQVGRAARPGGRGRRDHAGSGARRPAAAHGTSTIAIMAAAAGSPTRRPPCVPGRSACRYAITASFISWLTPAPYLLAVSALLSLSLLSRALQAGAAVVAVPVTSAFASLLPAAAGLAVFGEPVPKGFGLVAFVLALAAADGRPDHAGAPAWGRQCARQRSRACAADGEVAAADPHRPASSAVAIGIGCGLSRSAEGLSSRMPVIE